MSLATTFQEVESEVGTWISTELKAGETAVVNWYHTITPVLAADFAAYKNALLPIAKALIQGLAQALASMPGLDKLKIAAQTLAAMAGQQGLTTSITYATTLLQQIISSIGVALGAAAVAAA